MKAFKIVPSIAEYMDFRTLAKELNLGERDLILTNEYIYNPTIAALNLGCHTCFQEKFGGGEPTDIMVDAILDDLRGKEFDRIIAVGGGTVQIYRTGSSLVGGQTAGQQRRKHPSQHIPAAAPG